MYDAESITQNLVQRYGHACTLERFKMAPFHDNPEVLTILNRICNRFDNK